jgi:hypothetical protein
VESSVASCAVDIVMFRYSLSQVRARPCRLPGAGWCLPGSAGAKAIMRCAILARPVCITTAPLPR